MQTYHSEMSPNGFEIIVCFSKRNPGVLLVLFVKFREKEPWFQKIKEIAKHCNSVNKKQLTSIWCFTVVFNNHSRLGTIALCAK